MTWDRRPDSPRAEHGPLLRVPPTFCIERRQTDREGTGECGQMPILAAVGQDFDQVQAFGFSDGARLLLPIAP
jgi:hypothetical protein